MGLRDRISIHRLALHYGLTFVHVRDSVFEMGLVLTVAVVKDASMEAGPTVNAKTCGKRTGYRTLLS
jgi:hypothetical protein